MKCNHNQSSFLFSTNDFESKTYEFRKCRTCGLIYHLPPATGEQLDQHYNNYGLYSKEEYFQRELNLRKVQIEKLGRQLIKKLGSKNLKVLEIGSANGILLYWLRELFEFEVYGIELDPISSEYAKKLIEPDHIFVGHTENARFIDGSFDLVIMNQVIEHLPDPATVLHATKKALKPKGALYITTPNFGGISFRFLKDKWKNTCPNDHISMFSVKSLHRYLHDAGFKNLIVRSIGLSITSRRKGNAEYKITLPKVLDLVIRIIGKCLGLTNFGDGLFAYAWKE